MEVNPIQALLQEMARRRKRARPSSRRLASSHSKSRPNLLRARAPIAMFMLEYISNECVLADLVYYVDGAIASQKKN